MSLYTETPTNEIRVARGVYNLILETLDEALTLDDVALREAIVALQTEARGYSLDADGELSKRGEFIR